MSMCTNNLFFVFECYPCLLKTCLGMHTTFKNSCSTCSDYVFLHTPLQLLSEISPENLLIGREANGRSTMFLKRNVRKFEMMTNMWCYKVFITNTYLSYKNVQF